MVMKKQRENVIEKWVHCIFGDDSKVESDLKWNRMYLMLNEKGLFSLFEDQTMNSVKKTVDLTQWTLHKIVESQQESEFGTFRVSMKSKQGDIQFVFENKVERREMVNAMKQFIDDENEISEERKEVTKPNGMYLKEQIQCNIPLMILFVLLE